MIPNGPLPYLSNLPPAEEPRFWEAPGGSRIAWHEYGDPDGTPMFYYHGWPSSGLQARLVHHLAKERGMRVIALNRPGIGRSTYIPNRQLSDWPETVASFADAHGIGKFAQLGVSGGGPYVLACAARFPERVTASAVLCGAVPIAKTTNGFHPVYRALIPIRHLPTAFFSPLFALARRGTRGGYVHAPLSWLGGTLPEADRNALDQNPQTTPVFIQSFREGIRQGARGAMADADIYFQNWKIDLANISAEILYWHGAHDRNIPLERVKHFTAGIAGARLEIDETLGHFSLALHRAPDAMDHLVVRSGGISTATQ